MRHRRWRYSRKAEKPSIALLQSLPLNGKTLIDAGANWGVYSWIMSEAAGPGGAVHAFEPQPELCDHLNDLKASFRLSNLTINRQGLSSAPATLELQRPKVGSGEAGVNLPAGTFENSIEVPVTTLDLYLGEQREKPVAFIKADVQGHEYDVFKGAAGVLAEDKPILLFELFDYEAEKAEISGLLAELGYVGWFYHVSREDHASLRTNGRGMFVEFEKYQDYEHPREGLDFRNYFFVHRDSPTARKFADVAGNPRNSAALGR
jgi:FkbM family methyltransferase